MHEISAPHTHPPDDLAALRRIVADRDGLAVPEVVLYWGELHAVDGLVEAARAVGLGDFIAARHRVEHLEMVTPDQAAILSALGVVASVQPAFDAAWGGEQGMYAERLGTDRALAMNPFATSSAGCEAGDRRAAKTAEPPHATRIPTRSERFRRVVMGTRGRDTLRRVATVSADEKRQ